MTDGIPPVEYWPSASVRLLSSGLWEPVESGDPDASEVFLLQVWNTDDSLYDVVAWLPASPSPWWLRYGLATFLGEGAIALANLEHSRRAACSLGGDVKSCPVELVATPAEYVRRDGRALCILDWGKADVATIRGSIHGGVFCLSNPLLAQKFERVARGQIQTRVAVDVVERAA